jgi:hypothetical protein
VGIYNIESCEDLTSDTGDWRPLMRKLTGLSVYHY